MGKRGPNAYSDEFRREAVQLVAKDPRAIAQVARDLGIHRDTLRIWWRDARRGTEDSSAPGQVLSLAEENRQLRRENERLREEQEILKKATAFFAKDAR